MLLIVMIPKFIKSVCWSQKDDIKKGELRRDSKYNKVRIQYCMKFKPGLYTHNKVICRARLVTQYLLTVVPIRQFKICPGHKGPGKMLPLNNVKHCNGYKSTTKSQNDCFSWSHFPPKPYLNHKNN